MVLKSRKEYNDLNYIDVKNILKYAERMGAEKDKPEGFRYIQISDTLVKKMVKAIEAHMVALLEEYGK